MLTRGTLIYIGQRVLLIGFTLLVVSFGVFYAVHSLPGNAFVSEKVHGENLQIVLHQFGLDRPIWRQYLDYVGATLRGYIVVVPVDASLDATDFEIAVGQHQMRPIDAGLIVEALHRFHGNSIPASACHTRMTNASSFAPSPCAAAARNN